MAEAGVAGFKATPASMPNSRIAPQRAVQVGAGFGVDGQQFAAGLGVAGGQLMGFLDH